MKERHMTFGERRCGWQGMGVAGHLYWCACADMPHDVLLPHHRPIADSWPRMGGMGKRQQLNLTSDIIQLRCTEKSLFQ